MALTKLYDPKNGPMRLAIFMSGSGSNAVKILETYSSQESRGGATFIPVFVFTDNPESNAKKIADRFNVQFKLNSISDFYSRRNVSLRDMDTRKEYDSEQIPDLKDLNADAIALAGYDWVVSPNICNRFVVGNVHPGDLRVIGENGKRKYFGLAWIPSAKAILNGERKVHTSVHLVTSELDGGPLLAVSAPQPVPEEALKLEERVLLGNARSLKDITDFIKNNPKIGDDELTKLFPIYGYSRDCQERLKVHGDWVEFPEAIVNLSLGLYGLDESGKLYFYEKRIPDGVVRVSK